MNCVVQSTKPNIAIPQIHGFHAAPVALSQRCRWDRLALDGGRALLLAILGAYGRHLHRLLASLGFLEVHLIIPGSSPLTKAQKQLCHDMSKVVYFIFQGIDPRHHKQTPPTHRMCKQIEQTETI